MHIDVVNGGELQVGINYKFSKIDLENLLDWVTNMPVQE